MPMKIYTGKLFAERFICAIIVALSLSLSALTVQAEKNETSIDKIAMVNGSVITGEEFNRELSQVKERISQQGLEISSPQLEGIRNEILDNLINLELLFQESRNNRIKVEDKKPEKTIAYEDVKDDLAQHLKQEKTKQEVNEYIQKLREKSKIEKFCNT